MADLSTLQARLRADPRLQAMRASRPSADLTDTDLKALGYEVPAGYHYVWGGRAGTGTLMDNKRSVAETLAPIGAIAAGTIAGGIGLAGLGSAGPAGAASTAAAPSAAGSAAAAGGTLGKSLGKWLIPALQYVVPTVGNLIGAGMQAGANKDASALEAGFTQQALDDARKQREYEQGRDTEQRDYDRVQRAEALAREQEQQTYGRRQDLDAIARQQEQQAYGRQQYADFSKSLDPYRKAGLTASERLSQLLSRSSYAR